MVQKNLLVQFFVLILVINIGFGYGLKTSNKHKSMISKLKSETEKQEAKSAEAATPLVAPSSSSAAEKESESNTVAASTSGESNPVVNKNKDTDKVLLTTRQDAQDAIELLENETIEKDDELDENETAVGNPNETTPGFLINRFREVFVQLLRMFGLRSPSNKRKHRTMDMSAEDDNLIEPINYKEQIRTTVGAVLGRPDCIKRAACRAGSYLRDIKGKDIIIVILEKVAPSKWLETVQVVKESAIHHDECHYKCLED